MKTVNVKIVDKTTKFKVGDKVQFELHGKTWVDKIIHIGDGCVEGELMDLTAMYFQGKLKLV